jgi:hypothetical protein
LREVGLRCSNSLETYNTTWCHMNFPMFENLESETLAVCKIASIIDCCPLCSREIAYGNNVLIALRFDTIRFESAVSTIMSSFPMMRFETSSTRELLLGQKGG